MDTLVSADIVQFGNFRLDRRGRRLLRRDGSGAFVPVPVGSRALELLGVLVDHAGEVVTKQTIMDAVWPGTAVEESNLTVQLSTLRRILDAGRADGSCIQTVPGRGYRFADPIQAAPEVAAATAPGSRTSRLMRRRHSEFPAALLIGLSVAAGVLLLFGSGHTPWLFGKPDPPRLSLVVLPFRNLSGDASDDYLADAITGDLTSDLSHLRGALVIAHASANSYKGHRVDVKQVGQELGVRYALEGSVRRLGDVMRVNAEFVSAETGALLWSDRFDEHVKDLSAGQDEIVTRLRDALRIKMVDVEGVRSARERPTNPDSFDLYLRARSLWWEQPFSRQRSVEALALFERALALDPTSVVAMVGVASVLIEQSLDFDPNADMMNRAAALVARARAIEPNTEIVLQASVNLLRAQERWPELSEAAQRLIDAYPNNAFAYGNLADAKRATGHAEEAIPLYETTIRLSPRDPWVYFRYRKLAFALLLAGRDSEAIGWAQRSLATNPEAEADHRSGNHRIIAAAQALSGHPDEARRAFAEANRLWPFATVRSHFPEDPSSQANAAQIRRFQDGLRIAGERDHADEDADFGVVPDGALHREQAGLTPTGAPGVRTIRTADLVRFLDEARPVVIDTVSNSWGRSIPGAVGLKFAGLGGSFTDTAQDHLRRKMHALTAGDLNRPVVAVGYNSERFDGRNLALRLAALGYTQVYWYRGGREAWEVNGLPEATLTVEDW